MNKSIKILCQGMSSRLFVICCLLTINEVLGQNDIITITPQYTLIQTGEFKDKIILEGDIHSLFSLGCLYENEYSKCKNGDPNRYEVEIPYYLIMANRYSDPWACYMIYKRTVELYKAYGLEMDEDTLNFILYYLNKGADMDGENCLRELYYIYKHGILVQQDDEKYRAYWKRYETIALQRGIVPQER